MGHESHSSFKDRDRLDRGTPDSPKHFYVAARYRSQAPVRVPFRGPPLRAAPVSALGSVGFWVFAGVPGSGPGCAPALAGRWFVSGGLRGLGGSGFLWVPVSGVYPCGVGCRTALAKLLFSEKPHRVRIFRDTDRPIQDLETTPRGLMIRGLS